MLTKIMLFMKFGKMLALPFFLVCRVVNFSPFVTAALEGAGVVCVPHLFIKNLPQFDDMTIIPIFTIWLQNLNTGDGDRGRQTDRQTDRQTELQVCSTVM